MLSKDVVEVSGAFIASFLESLGPYQRRAEVIVLEYCESRDDRIISGCFYPLGGFLDALRRFEEQFGSEFITGFGALMAEKMVLPFFIRGPEEALAGLDIIFRLHHKNGQPDLGGYRWYAQPGGGRMICDNPYPCDFDRGMLAGLLNRFGSPARLRHDQPHVCRSRGGDACIYVVEW